RTRDRERVDAVVRVEALVLVGDQQIDIARIDVLDGRRRAPTSVHRCIGAQQLPIAINHDGREFNVLPKRDGPERMDPGRATDDREGYRDGGDANAPPPLRSTGGHFAASISTEPTPVRPKRSGRYMSSTYACGSTY